VSGHYVQGDHLAYLENLEMPGNLTAVREMLEIFTKSQGSVGGKSCKGKVA